MSTYKKLFSILLFVFTLQFSFTQTSSKNNTLNNLYLSEQKALTREDKVESLIALCDYFKTFNTRDLDSLDVYASRILKLTESENSLYKNRVLALDHVTFISIQRNEIDSAKALAQEIETISEQLNYGYGLSIASYRFSGISKIENDINMHIYHFENAYRIAKNNDVPKQYLFDTAVDLASTYMENGYETDIITRLLIEVTDLADDPNISLESKGFFYLNLAQVYDDSNQQEKALPNYQKSIDFFNQDNNSVYICAPLINMATCYTNLNNPQKGVEIYKETLALQIESSYCDIYYGLGNAYFNLKDYRKSENYFKKALAEFEKIQNEFRTADCLMRLGLIHLKNNDIKPSDLFFDHAIKKYQQIIEMNKADGDLSVETSNAYYYISQIHEFQENYELSLKNFKRFAVSSQKISTSQNLKVTERFDYYKGIVAKNNEIENLENVNKLQELQTEKDRHITIGLLLLLILILTLLAVLFNRYRLKQKSLRIIKNKNEENKLLMREIHHRVKNNLQIISSLLGTQITKHSGDDTIKAILNESQNKIKSIAIIHQNLYKGNQFTKVAVSSYIKELIVNIQKSFEKDKMNVQIDLDVSSQKIPVRLAVPLGLILNELITNSYKYAFAHTDDRVNTITISFKQIKNSSKFLLSISDNGIGIPSNFDIDSSPSFGLQLVHGLVNQLNGSITMDSGLGTTLEIIVDESIEA